MVNMKLRFGTHLYCSFTFLKLELCIDVSSGHDLCYYVGKDTKLLGINNHATDRKGLLAFISRLLLTCNF